MRSLSEVRQALKKSKGNVTKAAEALGVARTALSVWISRHADELGLRCERCGSRLRQPLSFRQKHQRPDKTKKITSWKDITLRPLSDFDED